MILQAGTQKCRPQHEICRYGSNTLENNKTCACAQRTSQCCSTESLQGYPKGLKLGAFHAAAAPVLFAHAAVTVATQYHRVPKFSPYGSVCCACAQRPGWPRACHSGLLAASHCKQCSALTSPSLHAHAEVTKT